MPTSFSYYVESFDVQPNNNVRLSTLFRLYQKAAGDDLAKLGMTYDVLREHGIAFILSKTVVRFLEDVHGDDNVTVTTYPRDPKGVAFNRDYCITVDGRHLIDASSVWVLTDVKEHKLLRPSALDAVGTILYDHDDLLSLPDCRLRLDASSLQRTDVRKVYYSTIDRNRHMNNTFYPDMVYDYLPDELRKTYKGKTFSIQYMSETREQESIEIFTGLDEHQFRLLAKHTATGKDVFAATLDF